MDASLESEKSAEFFRELLNIVVHILVERAKYKPCVKLKDKLRRRCVCKGS